MPDGGPHVRHVVLGADHGEHAGEADDAEVVQGDGVLEEGRLGAGAGLGTGRVGLYGLDHGSGGLRGEVSVVQDAPGDRSRPLRVVRRFPPRVHLVQADVVQERRDAQDLRVVGDTLRGGQLLCQGVDPHAVAVAPDRVRPDPRDERIDLFDQGLHLSESSE